MARPPRSDPLDDQLLAGRVVFLRDPIDEKVANETMERLRYLGRQSPDREIRLVINSPGGAVTATLAIVDTLETSKSAVATCVIGQAASGACLIAAAGSKGKRTAAPNARLMAHQPWGSLSRYTKEERAEIDKAIAELSKAVLDRFVRHTGQPEATLAREVGIDRFIDAHEAKTLGMIDRVLRPRVRPPRVESPPGAPSLLKKALRPFVPRPAVKNRRVVVDREIDDDLANDVILKLLALEQASATDEVSIEIDSSGGSVVASLALYDMMGQISCPVATHVIGRATGTACLLLAAGDPKWRVADANARIGFGDVFCGKAGSSSDIHIQVAEIARLRTALCEAFAAHTGRTPKQIALEFGKGVVMSAADALDYGLVDKIVE